MATKKKTNSIEVIADPENPGTVILSRWPTAKEKTKAFTAKVAKARSSAKEK